MGGCGEQVDGKQEAEGREAGAQGGHRTLTEMVPGLAALQGTVWQSRVLLNGRHGEQFACGQQAQDSGWGRLWGPGLRSRDEVGEPGLVGLESVDTATMTRRAGTCSHCCPCGSG